MKSKEDGNETENKKIESVADEYVNVKINKKITVIGIFS